ncbi:MAG: hypothetical protein K9I85_09325 [Saprospiraceae bacterium]|nr:hypothetical protein [Saprospiraceae bacterium]
MRNLNLLPSPRPRDLLILSFIFLWLALPIMAQRVTVSEGISLRKDDFYQILGRYNDRYLISSDNDYSLELSCLDDKMRVLWTKELELDKRLTQVIGIIPQSQSIVVLYQYHRKGDYFLKAHRYTPDGLLSDSITLNTYKESFYTPDSRIEISEDKTKAIVYQVEKQAWIEIQGIDLNSLTNMWSARVSIDAFSFFKEFRALIVDNTGKMHLVMEKDNRRSRLDDHSLELIEFGPNMVSPLTRNISLRDLLSRQIHFTYDNRHHRLTGVGLESDRDQSWSKGYFYFYISDEVVDTFKLIKQPFSEAVLSRMGDANAVNDKGIEDLEIIQVQLREDGGVVILMEESRKYERNTSGQNFQFGPGSGRFTVDYYYEDLYITSMGEDASLDWHAVLPKKQYSQDDDGLFSSCYIMTAPDHLRLIYNDEIAYENTVSAYQVDWQGEVVRNSILSTDYQKLKIIFREAVQTGVYELLVPSERSNKLKIVRIEF